MLELHENPYAMAMNESPASNVWLRLPSSTAALPALAFILVLTLLIHLRMLLAADWIRFDDAEAWRLKNWSYRYPFLLQEFADAFRHGIWYPRWSPDLMGGYGYPTFVFYQSGLFYFALPWMLLTGSAVLAMKFTLVLRFSVGGMGAYRLAGLFAPSVYALMAAGLFLVAPYLLVDLYVRAVYSEMYAIMLSPWCAYCLLRIHLAIANSTSLRPWILGWALSVALMITAHPFVTLHVLVALAMIGVGVWSQTRWKWHFPVVCGLGFVVSLALASPYLLTLLVMKHDIQYELGLFVYFKGLIPFFDIIVANPLSNLMMVFALWSGRHHPVMRAVALAWVWNMAVLSEAAYPLWEHVDPLRFTQLPSRLLSADMLLRLIGHTVALRLLAERLGSYTVGLRMGAGVMVCVLTFAASVYWPIPHPPTKHTSFTLASAYDGVKEMDYAAFTAAMNQRFEDMTFLHEFTPRSVDLKTFSATHTPFAQPMAYPDAADAATLFEANDHSRFYLHYKVTVNPFKDGGSKTVITIRQLYMEGWRVLVNGVPAEPFSMADGTIGVQFLAAGEYDLQAYYDGPTGWQWRNAMIVLVLMAAGFLLRNPLVFTPSSEARY